MSNELDISHNTLWQWSAFVLSTSTMTANRSDRTWTTFNLNQGSASVVRLYSRACTLLAELMDYEVTGSRSLKMQLLRKLS